MPNQRYDEESFQRWFRAWAKKLGLAQNPDEPEHYYDYRSAFRAGVSPGVDNHWDSRFKAENHPHRFIQGVDTKYNRKLEPPTILDIIAAMQMDDIPRRMPYASETDFFQSNPNVAGMASEDNNVLLNPYSGLEQHQEDAVLKNERARVFMRQNRSPNFYVTPEQQSNFANYGSLDDIAATIAARLFSRDPSAGATTTEQQDWVNRNLIIRD